MVFKGGGNSSFHCGQRPATFVHMQTLAGRGKHRNEHDGERGPIGGDPGSDGRDLMAFELPSEADFGRNLYCKTNPVDLEGSRG